MVRVGIFCAVNYSGSSWIPDSYLDRNCRDDYEQTGCVSGRRFLSVGLLMSAMQHAMADDGLRVDDRIESRQDRRSDRQRFTRLAPFEDTGIQCWMTPAAGIVKLHIIN